MRCPICQGAPVKGFSWQAPHVRVLKCASCGHLYAADPAPGQGMQPMPDPVAAHREHDEQNQRLVRRWLRDGFMLPGARVLDVGAGIGHVAGTVRDCVPGAHIYCLEPEPRACSRGSNLKDSRSSSLSRK
jgi:Zn ribbon nucleic-acid-binding protein